MSLNVIKIWWGTEACLDMLGTRFAEARWGMLRYIKACWGLHKYGEVCNGTLKPTWNQPCALCYEKKLNNENYLPRYKLVWQWLKLKVDTSL